MSGTNYLLMWKDREIGMLYHVKVGNGNFVYYNFMYKPLVEEDIAYPAGMYPIKLQGMKVIPDKDYEPTDKDITNWLESRVLPEDRQGVSTLLDKMNMMYHNPWQLTKKTMSVSLEDYYWLNDGNRKWEDHPRYLVEHSMWDEMKNVDSKWL